jgi:hypothetical protein
VLNLFNRSPEELAERERKREARQLEKAQRAFNATPIGQARQCFELGYWILQQSMDVSQENPSATLSGICREGWELVSASVVFVQQAQQSQPNLISGHSTSVQGKTIGHYVFRRAEANRSPRR